MAVRDPVELFVAQNVVLDALLYPLVYERIVDGVITSYSIHYTKLYDVLGHEQLDRIAHRHAVLHIAPQRLPGGILEPGQLAGFQRFGVAQQQAEPGQVLGDAQVVHGVVDARLGEGGAIV